MAYSRFGRFGKGLTDRAQRTYNIQQSIKRIAAAPRGRGLFQDLAFTRIAEAEYKTHFTSGGSLRGSYEALSPTVRGQIAFHDYKQAQTRKAQTKSTAHTGMGMISTTVGRKARMPFVKQKLDKDQTGAGVSVAKVAVLGGMGYIVWLMLR